MPILSTFSHGVESVDLALDLIFSIQAKRFAPYYCNVTGPQRTHIPALDNPTELRVGFCVIFECYSGL